MDATISLRIVMGNSLGAVFITPEVNHCAPILQYMQNWTYAQVCEYCRQQNWKLVAHTTKGWEVMIDGSS